MADQVASVDPDQEDDRQKGRQRTEYEGKIRHSRRADSKRHVENAPDDPLLWTYNSGPDTVDEHNEEQNREDVYVQRSTPYRRQYITPGDISSPSTAGHGRETPRQQPQSQSSCCKGYRF